MGHGAGWRGVRRATRANKSGVVISVSTLVTLARGQGGALTQAHTWWLILSVSIGGEWGEKTNGFVFAPEKGWKSSASLRVYFVLAGDADVRNSKMMKIFVTVECEKELFISIAFCVRAFKEKAFAISRERRGFICNFQQNHRIKSFADTIENEGGGAGTQTYSRRDIG